MLPIVIGVTGHRDLRDEDIPSLEKALRKYFEGLINEYKNSDIYLLCGLASGADSLIAKIASDFDRIKLVAVLPFETERYIEDFADDASKDQFHQLLESAASVINVTTFESISSREEGYVAVSKCIVRNAETLIAIWDGIKQQLNDNGQMAILPGGTADVVKQALDGVRSDNLLVPPERVPVEHFFALRTRNDSVFIAQNESRVGQRNTLPDDRTTLASAKNCFRQFDTLNKLGKNVAQNFKENSINYLLEGHSIQDVRPRLQHILDVYAISDVLASNNQKKRIYGILTVMALALLGFLCQQVFGILGPGSAWLFAYFILTVLSVAAYFYFFGGANRTDEQFLDWRSLAEAIRVQFFWKVAGVTDSVSSNYLAEDSDELRWLRCAVRGLDLKETPAHKAINLQWVNDIWMKGQMNYFMGKSAKFRKRNELYQNLALTSLVFAGVSVIATITIQLCGTDLGLSNYLSFASGVLFVLSASIKAFAEQMGYAEHSNRFRIMAQVFQTAIARFNEFHSKDEFENCRSILHAVGKEALAENATWLRTHRQRKFSLSLS